MVPCRIFMAAKIVNTAKTPQKGAPLPATHNRIRDSESLTLRLGRRWAFTSHSPLAAGHFAGMPSHLGPEASFSRHACREKPPATPAESTKPPKLLDTLSDPTSLPAGQAGIGILPALTQEGSGATRAKDLSDVTSRCNIALGLSSPASSLQRPAAGTYLDTPVEIEIESTLAESTTSPKTSRYTFDMLGNPFSATIWCRKGGLLQIAAGEDDVGLRDEACRRNAGRAQAESTLGPPVDGREGYPRRDRTCIRHHIGR
jgi:hypothetical protein